MYLRFLLQKNTELSSSEGTSNRSFAELLQPNQKIDLLLERDKEGQAGSLKHSYIQMSLSKGQMVRDNFALLKPKGLVLFGSCPPRILLQSHSTPSSAYLHYAQLRQGVNVMTFASLCELCYKILHRPTCNRTAQTCPAHMQLLWFRTETQIRSVSTSPRLLVTHSDCSAFCQGGINEKLWFRTQYYLLKAIKRVCLHTPTQQ